MIRGLARLRLAAPRLRPAALAPALTRSIVYERDGIKAHLNQLLDLATSNMTGGCEKPLRKTKTVCTVGPKTSMPGPLNELVQNGMNIMRLNFSHGKHEDAARCIRTLRDITDRVAIAIDTKGPEIRTGLTVDDVDIQLETGDEVVLTTNDAFKEQCSSDQIYVDYMDLPSTVHVGSMIFMDDGLLRLEVMDILDDGVRCVARNSAALGSRKGVNLPGAIVTLPAVSKKDAGDLRFAAAQDVDMIFASFVRKAEHVHEIRDVLVKAGNPYIKIISKIENLEGVQNYEEILDASDGIMVARGDLGIEIPFEKVFVAQKYMIRCANLVGKPVICATQMLESMIKNPRPTRAEVSDVANAVLDGADCVMLSGETTKGAWPNEAVKTMTTIATEAEASMDSKARQEWALAAVPNETANIEAIAAAAVKLAGDQGTDVIIAVSETGDTVSYAAKYRPVAPVIAATQSKRVARYANLLRGVYPILIEKGFLNVDQVIADAIEEAKRLGLTKTGGRVVVLHDNNIHDWDESPTIMRIVVVE
mmetsp:Transcript_44760/g.140360  ORF Transcript_44760/g.140360 Transcript_44760/m.140360 type:complete len:534 (-) Transcript_44760:80-1681(-)